MENFIASPRDSMNSSILGIGEEPRIVTAFNWGYSMQERSDPSFLGARTTAAAHSDVEC